MSEGAGPPDVESNSGSSRRRLLTITIEALAARMAGPAIRALELTRAVDASVPARVVSLTACDIEDPVAIPGRCTESYLRTLVQQSDCLLIQGDVLGLHPWIADLDIPIIVDAYDPFHLEQLEQAKTESDVRRRVIVRDCIRALNLQLSRADFVLCASDRQRDLWLGHLAALGRVNPFTYDASPDLSGLLAVVPFGVADIDVRPVQEPIRGRFPGIGEESVVALWSGGIYEWFDPELVVRAVALARQVEPRLHLVMMGTAHPVLGRPGAAEIRTLALVDQLDLTHKGVHLAPGWIPYRERTDWLRSADIGVLAHHAGVESEFAFRTRLLDHLWAGLPTVGTGGDVLTDLITANGAGVSVATGDVSAFAKALLRLAASPATRLTMSSAARNLAAEYHWSTVARPLITYCEYPTRAPDLVASRSDRALMDVHTADRSIAKRLSATMREGGPRLLATRLLRRVR